MYKKKDEKDKSFTAVSQIILGAQKWNKGNAVTCKATLNSKKINITTSMCKACLKYKPQMRIEKPRLRSIMTEKKVTTSCIVESADIVKVSWLVDGKNETQTEAITWKGEDQTISNLTLSTYKWKTIQTITCKADHPCFPMLEKTIQTTEPADKTPTVVIRRNLDNAVQTAANSLILECAAKDLPSGELAIALQNNNANIMEAQYVDLPKGLHTLTALFTVPETYQTKGHRFTCEIQSLSTRWKSNSTGNLFDDLFVELVVVPNMNKPKSTEQKLLCSGTGFNPTITWLPETTASFPKTSSVLMQGDGRLKVSIEISVPSQEWNNGVEFTCKVSDWNNLKPVLRSTSVCDACLKSKPQMRIEKPRLRSVMTERKVTISCIVESEYNVKVSWLVDGKNETQTEAITWKGEDQTISNLTIPTNKWKTVQTITCKADHPCFPMLEKTINTTEPADKTPTVVIRRNLDNAVQTAANSLILECAAKDLPSGELAIALQSNNANIMEAQYVDLPKGLHTLTALFTVPETYQTKGHRFTCEIQSLSTRWKSNSTGNLFDDLFVELVVVTNENKPKSTEQKLLCSGTGFNPTITWLPETTASFPKTSSVLMQGDGRLKVSIEISVPSQEWNNGVEFTCKVSDWNNQTPVLRSTSVCDACLKSKPQMRIEKPRLRSVMTERKVTISCIVESEYNVKVSWLVDGKNEMQTEAITWKGEDQTISNLTIPTNKWKTVQTITCKADHPCFPMLEKTINTIESVDKIPTVVIRRNTDDAFKRNSLILECAAKDLPSGELAITLQVDNNNRMEAQYVDLPKGLHTLTALFTVPETYQTKGHRFTCEIQSLSTKWLSSSAGNLFDDLFVELVVVPNMNKPESTEQKLLCSGTGFNPTINWLPKTTAGFPKTSSVLMQGDGRLKASSEISVPSQDWNSGEKYTCMVSDRNNSKLVQKSTSVCDVTPASAQMVQLYLLKPSISDLRSGNQVSVTCLLFGHKLEDFSITWKVGKDISTEGVTTQSPIDHNNGTQSMQSVYKIPAAKWKANTNIICEAKHRCFDQPKKRSVSKTKDFKRPTIQILHPGDGDLSGSQSMTFLCLISGFHPADISVHWELNGRPLNESHFVNSPVGTSADGVDFFLHSALMLPVTGSESDTYSCIVQHESSEKPISSTINNVYATMVQTSPSVVLLQGQGELVCLASGYSPSAIDITWLLDSMIVHDKHNTTSPAKGPDGKFTVKSHLHISALEWAPGATYFCKVKHVTGTVTRNLTKAEFIEQSIYFDENKAEATTQDQVEETWKMACSFVALFIISLIYGCTVTLIKVKPA